MFTDSPTEPPQDDKQDFIWSVTEEYLSKTKSIELEGKSSKNMNAKFLHFTFEISYYKAIKLLKDEQSGAYIKAICGYMFDDEEPDKLRYPITAYYELAKLKLDQSKARMKSGRKGGRTERKKITDEQISELTRDGRDSPFDDFMNEFTHIKNDIYEKSKYLLKDVDWVYLRRKLRLSEKYRNCTSLYQILTHRSEIENGS